MRRKRLLWVFGSVAVGLALGFAAANQRHASALSANSMAEAAAAGATITDGDAPSLSSSAPASLTGFSTDLIALDELAPPQQQAGQQAQPPQSAPGPDTPVEQVRRNIQVLRGLPNSQLFPLMNFIRASLGVNSCAYCHVRAGDEWDWASDERPAKRTAREMMRMTMSINRNNSPALGNNFVTCYTCHRGQREPVSLPPLPLTVSAHEPAPSASPSASPGASAERPPRPTVEQILNRYAEAVGGREAVGRVRTRVLRGTREATQGRNFPMEIVIGGPDKYLVTITTPEGAIQQSLNGAAGWLSSPREQRAANANELAQLRRAAEVYNILQVSTPLPGMRYAGRERIGERVTHVLEAPLAGGRGTEQFFFDAQTGLLLRRVMLTNAVLFPIPEQTDFEDYREVDGVRLPFTIVISNIDTYFSSTRRFAEIRHNVPVDETRFSPPPARR